MNLEQKESKKFIAKVFATFAVLMLITFAVGTIGLTNIKMLQMAVKLNQGVLGAFISLAFVIISINTLSTTVENGNYVAATIIGFIFCFFLGLDVILLYLKYGLSVFIAVIVAIVITIATAIIAYLTRNKAKRHLGSVLFVALIGYFVLVTFNAIYKLNQDGYLGFIGCLLFSAYLYWDFTLIYDRTFEYEIWTMTPHQKYCLILYSSVHLLIDFVNLVSSLLQGKYNR